MRKRFTRTGLPTVYRNLEELSVSGVVMKIVHPDRRLYYYFCRTADTTITLSAFRAARWRT